MSCNLYITDEPQHKLLSLFINIKNFYILDVQEMIKNMDIDMDHNSSVYIVNEEIKKILRTQSGLKRNLGIFYVVKCLSEPLVKSIHRIAKTMPDIESVILIDNVNTPKHTDLIPLFSDVFYYNRFRNNKIYKCTADLTENDDDILEKTFANIAMNVEDSSNNF